MMSATRGPEESTEKASSVQSVDRAISILELVATRGEVGITEIAEELDVHKSTASRLVAALQHRNLLEQLSERGKYTLSFGIVPVPTGEPRPVEGLLAEADRAMYLRKRARYVALGRQGNAAA